MYLTLTDFNHDGQSQWRSANYLGDIVHQCVRKYRCSLCSLTLTIPRRLSVINEERSGAGLRL